MTNFYEVDFHAVGENDSGDAISLRYGDTGTGEEVIHIVDGGYINDGEKVLNHIGKYYTDDFIQHVVLTHPDGDHACGLKYILEEGNVGQLWMNRPWLYVDELMPLFDYEYTRDGLVQRLKKNFPHTAELEKIANEYGIQINEAFQGQRIGAFTVLTPSRGRYIQLIVDSERTPDPKRQAGIMGEVYTKVREAINYIRSLWGRENLRGGVGATSRENEMSIVQYADFFGNTMLLTGDTGVEGLEEAYQYAVGTLGITLPGLRYFQVPHHGGRRNLSSEILDKWLGAVLPGMPLENQLTFGAVISANENDPDHPKKDVIRAIWHRGGRVSSTERCGFYYWSHGTALRANCGPAPVLEYPDTTEE